MGVHPLQELRDEAEALGLADALRGIGDTRDIIHFAIDFLKANLGSALEDLLPSDAHLGGDEWEQQGRKMEEAIDKALTTIKSAPVTPAREEIYAILDSFIHLENAEIVGLNAAAKALYKRLKEKS